MSQFCLDHGPIETGPLQTKSACRDPAGTLNDTSGEGKRERHPSTDEADDGAWEAVGFIEDRDLVLLHGLVAVEIAHRLCDVGVGDS